MKKSTIFILAIFLVFIAIGNVDAAKKRIGVVSFENASQFSDRNFGRGLADVLVSELVENKNYDVIERRQIDAALKEQFRGASGIIDSSTAAQIGKVLGLDYIVTGTIVEAGTRNAVIANKVKVVVNVKMFDATTGKIVFSKAAEGSKAINPKGSNSAAFSQAARRAIKQIAQEIDKINPVEGVVILCKDNTIMIDLGSQDGVEAGDSYIVVREGNPIYHPVTGEVVTVQKVQIATFKITEVQSNYSVGGKIKKLSDIEIKKGDIVIRSR